MSSDNDDGFRQVEPDNIAPPPHYREGRPQILTSDTGRQGPSGFRVLIVLVASLAATLIIWGAGSLLNLW